MNDDNPPPEYKRIYGQNIEMFNSNTDNPDELLDAVVKVIKNYKCSSIETFYKNKWTLLWTCYSKWYMQFEFTVYIYMSNDSPVVVFSRIEHIDNYMDYVKLFTEIVNKCDEIDAGKLLRYNISSDMSPLDPSPPNKLVPYTIRKMDDIVDIILECYNIDYSVGMSKRLASICDGSNEYHMANQETLLLNFPGVILKMLHSNKSILIESCAQALIHILLREKQVIAVEKLGYIDYEPMDDRDLSIAEDYAIKLSGEDEIVCL
jgi:hypothetical protein